MKATQRLHDLGQSLWLDNITRGLLTSGTLSRCISDRAATGLTSNPTVFDKAIEDPHSYDDAIHKEAVAGQSATIAIAGSGSRQQRRSSGAIARAQRPNLFIKMPGTAAGIPANEETIFAGVPVHVQFLFSREHYIAAAEACMRGIERRIAAGVDPKVASVASIFVSRRNVAIKDKFPDGLRNRLGIAIAERTYNSYRDLLGSTRWQNLADAGARPQRLLWASTGTKDPGRRMRFTSKRSRRRTLSTRC